MCMFLYKKGYIYTLICCWFACRNKSRLKYTVWSIIVFGLFGSALMSLVPPIVRFLFPWDVCIIYDLLITDRRIIVSAWQWSRPSINPAPGIWILINIEATLPRLSRRLYRNFETPGQYRTQTVSDSRCSVARLQVHRAIMILPVGHYKKASQGTVSNSKRNVALS